MQTFESLYFYCKYIGNLKVLLVHFASANESKLFRLSLLKK